MDDEGYLVYLATWPDVPEKQRPKDLFVNYFIPADLKEDLTSRGWELKDIRLLSPQKSIKGLLEGMRVGSIPMGDVQQIKSVLDLESKIFAMQNSKDRAPEEAEKTERKSTLEFLGKLGTDLKTTRTQGTKLPKKKRKRRATKLEMAQRKIKNG